jgi:hypothetical protein
VPAAIPVKRPVVEMVPVVTGVLLHTPPVVRSVSWVVNVSQTVSIPVIATGVAFTVTTAVAAQVPSV